MTERRRPKGERELKALPPATSGARAGTRWRARIDRGGRRVQRTFKTQREGQLWLDQEKRAGAMPQMDRRLTLGSFLDDWLQRLEAGRKVRPNSLAFYGGSLRHVPQGLRRVPLLELTRQDLERLYADLLQSRLSARSVFHVHGTVKRALTTAVDEGKFVRNPAIGKGICPKFQRIEMQVLSASDARALLDALRGTRLEASIVVALTTGMRQGELIGVQWQDIDLSTQTLNIRRALVGRSKPTRELAGLKTGNARRTIALSDVAVDAFRSWQEHQREAEDVAGSLWANPSDLVITDELGHVLQPTALVRALRGGLQRAGLKRIRWHDLRHTCPTLLLNTPGVNPRSVTEQLGHATVAFTLQVYGHTDDDARRRTAAAADSALQHPTDLPEALHADADVEPAVALNNMSAKLRILVEMRADGILTDGEFAAKASVLAVSQ